MGAFVQQDNGDRAVICDCASRCKWIGDDLGPLNADAKLIAAAPDLAEALLAVKAWIERYHGPSDFKPLTQVRAALSKAGVA
jgi:hypothetical protein